MAVFLTHEEHGIHITPQTATNRWGGTIDYNMTIAGLVHRAQRARDVSAETSANARPTEQALI